MLWAARHVAKYGLHFFSHVFHVTFPHSMLITCGAYVRLYSFLK